MKFISLTLLWNLNTRFHYPLSHIYNYHILYISMRQLLPRLAILKFNQSGNGMDKRPPRFSEELYKMISHDSEWLRSRDWKSPDLRYLGYFSHISDTDFFSKSRVFLLICAENFIFYDKIINTPCIPPYKLLWSSGYDLRLWLARSCVRISRTTCF